MWLWRIRFRKIPIKNSSIVWYMSVHAWCKIVSLSNILHNSYITHYHIHCPLRFEIRIMVTTIECSSVAGACDAACCNKGGTLGFSLSLLKFGPTYLLKKIFWLGERKKWRAWTHHAHAFWSVEDRQKYIYLYNTYLISIFHIYICIYIWKTRWQFNDVVVNVIY